MTTFTKTELIAISILVVENKNSAKLQKSSSLSYMESINLGNKIDTMIEEMSQVEWLESQKRNYDIEFDYGTQEMVIQDNINDIEYRIDSSLVDDGKIVPYYIENAENYADELERIMIPEARSESDRELMREDLETLRNTEEEYVFGNYGSNGFITKEDDIEEFNRVCLEIIESYKEYIQNELKFDKIKYDSYLDTINKIMIEENLEQLPNIPSLIYLQKLNKDILCVDKRDTDNIKLYWGKDCMYEEVISVDLEDILDSSNYLNILAKEEIKKFIGENYENK